MWPWRRPEVVLVEDAGDDATAALTTILRFHRRSVTTAEVRRAVRDAGDDPPSANTIVAVAERFRLQTRGLLVEDPQQIMRLALPCIVHMSHTPGQYPRPLGEVEDGYFAVLTALKLDRVHWIDPYEGAIDATYQVFFEYASGAVLVFGRARPLPPARLTRG